MCSNEAHGLAEVWGGDFEELYERYERVGRGRKTIKAQKLLVRDPRGSGRDWNALHALQGCCEP